MLLVLFLLLLLAGTKFRVRDATATLDGAIDAQVVMELGLFALIAVALAAVWLRRGVRTPPANGELAIGAYVAIAGLSVLWSASLALTLVRAGQLAIVAAAAIVAVRVLTPMRALWTAVVAVTLHVLIFGAAALLIPGAAGEPLGEREGRFAWFGVHPIEVATLAALATLGLIGAALYAPAGTRARLFGLPVSIVALATGAVMVAASSRGALLAFALSAVVVALLRLHGTLRVPLVLAGAAATLALVVAGPNVESALQAAARQSPVLDRTFFRGQGAETVLEMNGRIELWQDLLPVAGQQPLTGFGYQASRGVLLATAEWAAYAHNALMQTLLDLGIFGLMAVIAVIACALAVLLRGDLAPWVRATTAGAAIFLVVNSISAESFAAAPGFDALMLFLCALIGTRPAETGHSIGQATPAYGVSGFSRTPQP